MQITMVEVVRSMQLDKRSGDNQKGYLGYCLPAEWYTGGECMLSENISELGRFERSDAWHWGFVTGMGKIWCSKEE